ncbi:hypothetical protein OG754_26760 [Streptomyces decoyicus]|uniref:hypothetical protein n=1 Tax=Streptomyces TaxID=1883 RepID=UPI002E35A04E|nr:hypothetical protein [Streptomyces decoyicus]
MNRTRTSTKCRRQGCRFNRLITTSPAGKQKVRPHCSAACYVWERHARRVVEQTGHGAEMKAAEIMRVSALLDARPAPTNIPEAFEL